MTGHYLLGVDVGSSNCKVILVRDDGTLIAGHSLPYPTHHPRIGWAEQDPNDWYRVACDTIRACLAKADISPDDIAALSIDGPAHNVALMDADFNILRPTIHWSDLRSVPQAERLGRDYGQRVFDITYCQCNPSWTLTQLLWLKEHDAATWANLRRILVTKDYVRLRFTGQYLTDVYDAIGTQLYDVKRNRWSSELCDLLGFDETWLPDVVSSTHIGGHVLPDVAEMCGLPPGIPVMVGSGDSVVEAFGIGAIDPGHCLVKLGTAANVNLVTARPYPSRQSITYRHVVDARWFTITATNAGASTMRWFRTTFCQHQMQQAGDDFDVHHFIDQLASDAPPGSDGLLFHPYLNGERSPYWDPLLRGDFVGIHTRHDLSHFARAILEGVAFSIRDCMQVVQSLGEDITRISVIGGGSKSHLWRQILADVLGQPLQQPAMTDAAYGAALVAGVGIGMFDDWQQAVEICAGTDDMLQPNNATHSLYNELFEIYRDITHDLTAHYHRLAHLTENTSTPEHNPA